MAKLGDKALSQFSGVLLENFIQDLYNIQPVDFENDAVGSTDLINEWVNGTTNGKIAELFPEPLLEDTLMVLASTLYFKGTWKSQFESATGDHCWQTSIADIQRGVCHDEVSFMTQTASFNHYFNPKYTVIEIPMKHGKEGGVINRFTMLLWIPEPILLGSDEDAQFQNFIMENSANIRTNFTRKERIKLTIPKFSLDESVDLIKNMKNMGISSIFQNGDFTPMLGEGIDAKVSKISHAVKLDIDEKGIEGAAATAVQISFRSGFKPKLVEVVRPFYFSISNRCFNPKEKKPCASENVPIFVGKVVNPVSRK